ncbi:MAG: polyprenyl synthetase family protein [Actinomycetota bacterium]|nr:polyprenyl synthetase family protein [Actinomycetota bacterium]
MIGPSWLVEDMLRVEQLLLATAGSSDVPLVGEASTHLIKAGGKRLRPALVMISSRAGAPGSRATDLAAAAIELVHLATLYHDDVIDETDTRRGAPTVHSKWGLEVAVLAGDYLFAKGCVLAAEAGGEVTDILSRAIAEVCEGQIVETTAVGDPRRAPDEYRRTIELKTAALFGAAGELGPATSGAPELREPLRVYGRNLGLAFQIVDDLLDLVGDPEVTGKVPGTDLKEGVFTLPVLIAAEREPLLVERIAAGSRDLAELLPLLRSSGAIDAALAEARAHVAAALKALEPLADCDWTEALRTIPEGVLAQL